MPQRIAAASTSVQTEDPTVGAVKNARGTLIGWTLSDVEATRVQTLSEEEVVLEQRPLQLLIKLKAPVGTLEGPYGDGVYCMKPRIRVWSRDNAGYAKAIGTWNPWYLEICLTNELTASVFPETY